MVDTYFVRMYEPVFANTEDLQYLVMMSSAFDHQAAAADSDESKRLFHRWVKQQSAGWGRDKAQAGGIEIHDLD